MVWRSIGGDDEAIDSAPCANPAGSISRWSGLPVGKADYGKPRQVSRLAKPSMSIRSSSSAQAA